MSSIIFLDIDGVLHYAYPTSEKEKFSQMPLLARIVQETGSSVVLSSAWRQFKTAVRDISDSMIAHDMQPPVGSTPSLLLENREREIAAWLLQHEDRLDPGYRWIAIDDRMLKGLGEHFVHTRSCGLTDADVDRAIALLGSSAAHSTRSPPEAELPGPEDPKDSPTHAPVPGEAGACWVGSKAPSSPPAPAHPSNEDASRLSPDGQLASPPDVPSAPPHPSPPPTLTLPCTGGAAAAPFAVRWQEDTSVPSAPRSAPSPAPRSAPRCFPPSAPASSPPRSASPYIRSAPPAVDVGRDGPNGESKPRELEGRAVLQLPAGCTCHFCFTFTRSNSPRAPRTLWRKVARWQSIM